MPIFIFIAFFAALYISGSNRVEAATSDTLNFQGRLLTNSGSRVPDGSYNIEFKLYDDELAGTNLWTETRSGGNAVSVENGYFSVYLGDVTAFGASIPWDQELWLTMNVESDGEMTPRFKLSAVPYAFRAGAVTDSSGNAFTGDDLVQATPSSIQALNAANAAIRLNQTGSGGLLQLQGDGSDVFTVDKTGSTVLGSGLTVGNSTNTTAGTIRWSGTDLEVYDGTQWTSLTSGGGGGGGTLAIDAFYAYDSAGGIDISAGFTDVTLDSEIKEDAPFTHAVDSSDVTINEDGWYEITYNIGTVLTTSNTRSQSEAKLQENTGGGFTDIPGSLSTIYNRQASQGRGSASVTVIRQFTSGDVVKLVASGDANITTEANTVGLSIRKFIDTTGLGGSGTSFEQNGNNFGTTAILGTTDSNGLNIITDNTTALSLSAAGDATFSNSLTINSGGLSVDGGITSTSGLTLSSGGASGLTLDSANDILSLADQTIQRSASGTTTIDLLDNGGGTILSILNSDISQSAGLLVEGGVTATSFTGDGSGLSLLSANAIASGTINDARLSSNVSLLYTSQTFTGQPTFSSGIVLGNTAVSTNGALRWTGADFEGYDGSQWVSLTSGSGGSSGTPATATFYDSTGGQTIASGVFSTVNIDATLDNSDGSILSLASDTVTVSEAGYYEISYSVTARVSSGTRSGFNAKLQLDSGSGFNDVAGSQAYHYGRITSETQGTSSAKVVLNLGAGDSLRIQGQGTSQSFSTIADASNLTITRVTAASVTGGGGGGTSFEQGGNAFGTNAILGTTDTNGLNIITNSNTALSFTTSGAADFAQSVDVTGDLTLDSRLLRGTLATADANAQVAFYTGSATSKGLIIQGAPSQTANLFELQDDTGTVLTAFNSSGGLVLGDSTLNSLATSARSVTLPDASGTICLSGGNCGFLELASGSFQNDSTTNDSIAINKLGASGNLIALQKNGSAVFTVANTGGLEIQDTSTTALDIRNVGGSSYFSVDTANGIVRVGPQVADANGILFVLDTKNTAGDPTGVDGAQYYNSSLGKFRCYENGVWRDCINSDGPSLRSFVDTNPDALVDANTTNYWDIGAENNNSSPNITLSAASGKSVYGVVTFELTSNTNQDVEATARVERGIGTVPTCGSGTSVGGSPGIFASNSGAIKSSTVTFIDTPNTTSQVFYVLCSDSATAGNTSADITRIRITLQEVENVN